MTQVFAEGMQGGSPPWKEGEKIDLKIAHWVLFGPGQSGMYETTRELIMAENQMEGVLAGMCETPKTEDTSEPTLKVVAEGGRVDPRFPNFRTQDWGWAMKWADIHMVHSTMSNKVAELKPKAFLLHGTVEASLENDLVRNVQSLISSAEWVQQFEASFVTSHRAFDFWSPYDYTGEKVHLIPKGIDLEWWQRSTTVQDLDGEPSVLYGEIWRSIKHPYHLLFAVNEIYKKNPKVRFNPWGLDYKIQFWNRVVDWTEFRKFIGKRGVRGIEDYPAHWYSRGDVYVNTGLYGDPSRAHQEALACGCPSICWDTDPYGDCHAYKYVKPFDVRDMAQKITETYNEVLDNREEVAKRCRNLAIQYFDIQEEAKQIVKVLRDVVSNQ